MQCVETALADVDPGAGAGAVANKDTAAFRKAKVWKHSSSIACGSARLTGGGGQSTDQRHGCNVATVNELLDICAGVVACRRGRSRSGIAGSIVLD